MRMRDEELRLPSDLPFDRTQRYRLKLVEYTKPTTHQHGHRKRQGTMSYRKRSAMMPADESTFD